MIRHWIEQTRWAVTHISIDDEDINAYIDAQFEAWQRYRRAINPYDSRSLVEQIIVDYSRDVKLAESNWVARIVLWVLQANKVNRT